MSECQGEREIFTRCPEAPEIRPMSTGRKQQLVELGADQLADALLELASHENAADDLIERMIATPQENIKRFKAKLSGLKRSRRFIGWSASAGYARELRALLHDLQAGVDDPRAGAALVAAFYETDDCILGNCDDSNGVVGDLFRHDARELFVGYAQFCDDKEWLAELLFKVSQTDNYGVRNALIDSAVEFLPESVIRALIPRFQDLASSESDEYRKRHWLFQVESLARQLKDAPLFEQTQTACWGSLSTAACVDIARVYLESGDGQTALTWLEKISETDSFMAVERDSLLIQIYARLENSAGQAEVAWRIFRRYRSLSSLKCLLEVIGHDQRGEVLAGDVATILADGRFSTVDAAFLVEIERNDDAEAYLFKRTDQLNGDNYSGLLPLAEAMENTGRHLCASMLYRALLDSILRRGQTKTYTHGVRYLRKLDALAPSVSDWLAIEDHATYKDNLQKQHGRKSSFWSRYQESKIDH